MVLEKTLESPLVFKESNQSILKEISPECSLEGLMLELKLQYFGQLMRRVKKTYKRGDTIFGLWKVIQGMYCVGQVRRSVVRLLQTSRHGNGLNWSVGEDS